MRISDWSSDVCSSDLSLAEGDAGLFAFRGVADGIGTEEEGGAVAAGCFPARAVDAQGAGRQRRAEAEVGIVRQLPDERRVHRPDLLLPRLRGPQPLEAVLATHPAILASPQRVLLPLAAFPGKHPATVITRGVRVPHSPP